MTKQELNRIYAEYQEAERNAWNAAYAQNEELLNYYEKLMQEKLDMYQSAYASYVLATSSTVSESK